MPGQLGLGAGRGVLVVVQHPAKRRGALGGRVGGGPVGGVAADQVVHAVPAVPGLDEQPLAVQHVQ
ncbi:MAG TPA: hypothetical protein VK586_20545, partial [Streptosporangiaceae bacterium]|nr:hypothetical protein [Streptosporangiaceae bacterium]